MVAVSPFVGWDEIIHWMAENPNINSPKVVAEYRRTAEKWKVAFQRNPRLEVRNALLSRISDIHAPVLFLQGTGDKNVVWQIVREYANDMKKAHKTVELVIYPGGSHGLHDQYQYDSTNAMVNWLYKFGMPDPWL